MYLKYGVFVFVLLPTQTNAPNNKSQQGQGTAKYCHTTYLTSYMSVHGSAILVLDHGSFFSFLILYTPWTRGAARIKAATYTQNNKSAE
jgi:hypothetical protein